MPFSEALGLLQWLSIESLQDQLTQGHPSPRNTCGAGSPEVDNNAVRHAQHSRKQRVLSNTKNHHFECPETFLRRDPNRGENPDV
jgi:hypothetical protein